MRRFLVSSVLFALAALAAAKDFQVVVPQLSPVSTTAYQKLAEAVVAATGNKAVVQVVPFARAIYAMENKQADIESLIVSIPDKSKWAALKFDYATVEAVRIVFVLYSRKGLAVDISKLKKGDAGGLKIETDAAHTSHFPFAISPSTSPDASLKKVDAGEIDAYLFSQSTGDAALKRLGYKNVVRAYYDTYSGTFIIQKGQAGGEVDKMLSDGMAKIRANGTYQTIMADVVAAASKYIEWQP